MKLFLLIIVLICCLLLGIGISKYYASRERFFSDLCQFCKYFKLKVSFSMEKLPQIIHAFMTECSSEFRDFLVQYEKYIKSNIDKVELAGGKTLNFLRKEEKEDILKYFLSMGELSAVEEIEKSQAKLSYYECLKEKCSSEKKKFSSFYIKLFVILALFIFVIFI